jgi:hypothetical protein
MSASPLSTYPLCPARVVQTSVLATAEPPDVKYRLHHRMDDAIRSGKLSTLQVRLGRQGPNWRGEALDTQLYSIFVVCGAAGGDCVRVPDP